MSLKEKMMEAMIGRMSKEEKQAMMNNMMEKFFSDMSSEEKSNMMAEMMPKMMGGGMNMMMAMMGKMPGDKNGFDPMEMCKKMMGRMEQSDESADSGTAELRGLFNEWLEQMGEEVEKFTRNNESVTLQEIARHFKLSEESVNYLLEKNNLMVRSANSVRPGGENPNSERVNPWHGCQGV